MDLAPFRPVARNHEGESPSFMDVDRLMRGKITAKGIVTKHAVSPIVYNETRRPSPLRRELELAFRSFYRDLSKSLGRGFGSALGRAVLQLVRLPLMPFLPLGGAIAWIGWIRPVDLPHRLLRLPPGEAVGTAMVTGLGLWLSLLLGLFLWRAGTCFFLRWSHRDAWFGADHARRSADVAEAWSQNALLALALEPGEEILHVWVEGPRHGSFPQRITATATILALPLLLGGAALTFLLDGRSHGAAWKLLVVLGLSNLLLSRARHESLKLCRLFTLLPWIVAALLFPGFAPRPWILEGMAGVCLVLLLWRSRSPSPHEGGDRGLLKTNRRLLLFDPARGPEACSPLQSLLPPILEDGPEGYLLRLPLEGRRKASFLLATRAEVERLIAHGPPLYQQLLESKIRRGGARAEGPALLPACLFLGLAMIGPWVYGLALWRGLLPPLAALPMAQQAQALTALERLESLRLEDAKGLWKRAKRCGGHGLAGQTLAQAGPSTEAFLASAPALPRSGPVDWSTLANLALAWEIHRPAGPSQRSIEAWIRSRCPPLPPDAPRRLRAFRSRCLTGTPWLLEAPAPSASASSPSSPPLEAWDRAYLALRRAEPQTCLELLGPLEGGHAALLRGAAQAAAGELASARETLLPWLAKGRDPLLRGEAFLLSALVEARGDRIDEGRRLLARMAGTESQLRLGFALDALLRERGGEKVNWKEVEGRCRPPGKAPLDSLLRLPWPPWMLRRELLHLHRVSHAPPMRPSSPPDLPFRLFDVERRLPPVLSDVLRRRGVLRALGWIENTLRLLAAPEVRSAPIPENSEIGT